MVLVQLLEFQDLRYGLAFALKTINCKLGSTCHIIPASATKCACTWTHISEAKVFVESNQMVMRNQSDSVCNFGILDPLHVSLHYEGT